MFNNYIHFRNYCLKIMTNKEYEVSEDQVNMFDYFKVVVNVLDNLKNEEIITFEINILDKMAEYFRYYNFSSAFSLMDNAISLMFDFSKKNIKFNEVINELNSSLKLDIKYKEDFIIDEKSKENPYYPNEVNALVVKNGIEKIYTLSDFDESCKNKFGVYFIYSSAGEIVYIGQSNRCILTKALQDAKGKNLLSFSKIELRECKTKSDILIYEAYYISLYKPKYNIEKVYDDEVSILLPELDVMQTITKDINTASKKVYTYYDKKTLSIDEFFEMKKENKEVYIDNDENIKLLNDKDIYQKYIMKQKVHEYILDNIKDKNNSDLVFDDFLNLI